MKPLYAGWRLRLTRPTEWRSGRTGSPARRSAAGELDGGLSRFVPGGGCALPGLRNGVPAWTGSPARRSAAGMGLD
ncbi:hypothetical protein [Klebsiella aerogenes]|uniref:hypothetical protein n=1 Tax=Klebsiella aerogenes TaxID=548 RepID=UPI000A6A3B17|nr:hypothetical protein [Klebsiella aerogenes]